MTPIDLDYVAMYLTYKLSGQQLVRADRQLVYLTLRRILDASNFEVAIHERHLQKMERMPDIATKRGFQFIEKSADYRAYAKETARLRLEFEQMDKDNK